MSFNDVVPGAGYGLTMVLNIEQYEYMKGPYVGAGVKVGLCVYTQ
jgi:hypothetical protein